MLYILYNLSSFLFISLPLCNYLYISPFLYLYISNFLHLYISYLSLSDLAAVVIGFIRLLPTDLHEEATLWIHWSSWRFIVIIFLVFNINLQFSLIKSLPRSLNSVCRCKSIDINTIASRCMFVIPHNDIIINIIYFKYKI